MTLFDTSMELAMFKHITHNLIDMGLEPYEIRKICDTIRDEGFEYDEYEDGEITEIGDNGERYIVTPVMCTLTVCVELPRNKCLICEFVGDASIAYDMDGGYLDSDLWTAEMKSFYYGDNEEQ